MMRWVAPVPSVAFEDWGAGLVPAEKAPETVHSGDASRRPAAAEPSELVPSDLQKSES